MFMEVLCIWDYFLIIVQMLAEYIGIDEVIESEKDLVEVVTKLKPLAVVKG